MKNSEARAVYENSCIRQHTFVVELLVNTTLKTLYGHSDLTYVRTGVSLVFFFRYFEFYFFFFCFQGYFVESLVQLYAAIVQRGAYVVVTSDLFLLYQYVSTSEKKQV